MYSFPFFRRDVQFSRTSQEDANVAVAVLVSDLRGSGVVRNAVHLARACIASGLNAELVVVSRRGEMERLAQGVPVRELLRDAPRNRALANTLAIVSLRQYFTRQSPKILFSTGNHIHPLAALAAWRHPHRPQIVMRASNDINHYSEDNPGHLALLSRRLFAHPVMRTLFKAADQIVAVSADLARVMTRDLGLEGAKLFAIPNGVDCERIRALSVMPLDDPWFAPGAPPVVVSTGRLVAQKNYESLIRAVALIRAKRALRLMIFGVGPRLKVLVRLAHELGIADDVRFPGFESNPFRFMARAGAFVLSSKWEGQSNALLEAMACGCPVVATDCPTGNREVMGDGAYGPLVPVDDDKALADAIAKRLEQPRRSAHLIQGAAQFSIASMTSRYLSLFHRICALQDVGVAPEFTAAQNAVQNLAAE